MIQNTPWLEKLWPPWVANSLPASWISKLFSTGFPGKKKWLGLGLVALLVLAAAAPYLIELIPPRSLTAEEYLKRGVLAFKQGRLDVALVSLQDSLNLDSKRPETRYAFAQILESAGRDRWALAEYRSTLELLPLDVRVRYNLAAIEYRSGNRDDAESILKEILRIGPNFFGAQAFLAKIAEDRGFGSEAAAYRQRASELRSLAATEAMQPELTLAKLCTACHTGKSHKAGGDVFREERCANCHAPHSLVLPPELKVPPLDKCSYCHFEYSPLRMKEKKFWENFFLHEPVNQQACSSCHTQHALGVKSQLTTDRITLCSGCHNPGRELSRAVQHQPFTQGDCLTCHDPHLSPHPKILAKQQDTLCFGCHAKAEGERRLPKQHGPFGEVTCSSCHRPHSSDFPRLIKSEGRKLCFTCHKDQEKLLNKKPVKHPPFKNGECTYCHSPHASEEIKLVRFYPLQYLCFQCHPDKKDRLETAVSRHPLGTLMSCIDCHNPHASDFSRLRLRNGNELCFGCHDKKPRFVETPHSQVEGRGGRGACTNCHNPHGSIERFMLILDQVTTCKQCHPRPPMLFQHPVGDRMDPDKGRTLTCASTCHDPHGTGFRRLLRKEKDALCITCHKDKVRPM